MTKEQTTLHALEFSINNLIEKISEFDTDQKIDIINSLKLKLHEISPFKNEPVDCVLWVRNEEIKANDYNP